MKALEGATYPKCVTVRCYVQLDQQRFSDTHKEDDQAGGHCARHCRCEAKEEPRSSGSGDANGRQSPCARQAGEPAGGQSMRRPRTIPYRLPTSFYSPAKAKGRGRMASAKKKKTEEKGRFSVARARLQRREPRRHEGFWAAALRGSERAADRPDGCCHALPAIMRALQAVPTAAALAPIRAARPAL